MVRACQGTVGCGCVLGAVAVLAAVPAFAHSLAPVGLDLLWTRWSFDPVVLAPMLLGLWLYVRGGRELRARFGRLPRTVPPARIAAFLFGQALLVIALFSPLEALSGTVMSAHMVQHVLLIAVAPPLLLAGRPEIVAFWGLPASTRRGIARERRFRAALATLRAVAHPLPASLLSGAALWIWHAPGPFEAVRASEWLHRLEHASFFFTALLFWRCLIGTARRPAAAAAGAAAALVAMVHGGFLAALIGLSPTVLFPASTEGAPLCGLTPLEDQQLAGAIMWVPAGAIYLIAGLVLAARVLAVPEPARALAGAAEKPKAVGS